MAGLKDSVFMPRPEAVRVYDRLFLLYRKLHDSFGTKHYCENLFGVMKELLEIKRSA